MRHVRALLAAACAALLALPLWELALRLLHPVPFAAETNMYFEADPYTGYRMRPNSEGSFGAFLGAPRIRARTNSQGHRDDETSLERPAGTRRLLALGDSMTVGTNVTRDEAWPQALEALLSEGAAAPVEVINAGVGGWSPFQYAQYYEHYGRSLGAQRVLLGFTVGNDTLSGAASVERLPTALHGRRVRSLGGAGDRAFKRFLVSAYEHSHLVRLFVNTRRFVPSDEELEPAPEQPRDSDAIPASYLELLRPHLANHRPLAGNRLRLARNSILQVRRIQRLASGEGAELRVVLLPDELQVNAALPPLLGEDAGHDLDLSLPQAMLVQELRAAGIETLDLLPIFRRDPRRLYLNDGHWTPAGHRLAAEAIADWIHPAALGSPRR